jgi:hypothetical protein
MKFQKATLIGLLTLILLLSVISGHFLPPLEILICPIVISIMTWLILFTNNGFNITIKSVLSYLYIGLNDIGIKLFGGGIHDFEGMGFIHLLLFIGLIPCFIMLLIAVRRDTNSSKCSKVSSILLFILLIYVHLQLFQRVGVDQDRYHIAE